jgi:heptosyltransferase-3
MRRPEQSRLAVRYFFDRQIRAFMMLALSWITPRSAEERADLTPETIKRILLVRSLFRMGDSVLATPAIGLFRKNFPEARIDFVGPIIGRLLFKNLEIDHYYEVYQRFPKVCWSYLGLLKQVRATKYDLAVDVSGSSAALGSFIVGFSVSRLRVGLKGRWDRWFNVRLARPASLNKYAILPELVRSMGLKSQAGLPTLVLSPEEKERGRQRLLALVDQDTSSIVGVFVGGRKTRGKRWARQNFLDLVTQLRVKGTTPIIFVGPEERDILAYFQQATRHEVPIIFEPNARIFASLVANCDLFVACDSGPVHLACALRVRTVAIFLQNNFDRWGPPPSLGRVVYRESGIAVADVLQACQAELAAVCRKSESQNIANG